MSLKKTISILAASTVMVCGTPAFSHDPENNPGKAKHGGQYIEYEQHHGIEMVSQKDKLIFHMTEHLQPADMTGSAFKVFVQTESGMQTLAIKPDGSTLVADIKTVLPSGAKIVLTGKDSDGHTLQARFVTK